MTSWVLLHDLRAPDFGTPPATLYREALDMTAWADARGCPRVVLSEHHGSPDGYLPSPFVFGAAVAARTAQVRIMISALVLTLRDPVSAAEDAAVLDLVSGGRLELTLVPGYVPAENEMFGVPFAARGAVFEEKVAAFTAALEGGPVIYAGRRATVTPRPLQRPRPFVAMGGAAPKRAARLADAFLPPTPDPALADTYRAECRRLGKGDGILMWPDGPAAVFVTEDPERTWAEIGRHVLHEADAYAAWSAGIPGSNPWVPSDGLEGLQRSGHYAVVTPAGCVDLARGLDPRSALRVKPLVAGLDPETAWRSLELFVDRVAPVLAADGD